MKITDTCEVYITEPNKKAGGYVKCPVCQKHMLKADGYLTVIIGSNRMNMHELCGNKVGLGLIESTSIHDTYTNLEGK